MRRGLMVALQGDDDGAIANRSRSRRRSGCAATEPVATACTSPARPDVARCGPSAGHQGRPATPQPVSRRQRGCRVVTAAAVLLPNGSPRHARHRRGPMRPDRRPPGRPAAPQPVSGPRRGRPMVRVREPRRRRPLVGRHRSSHSSTGATALPPARRGPGRRPSLATGAGRTGQAPEASGALGSGSGNSRTWACRRR